VGPGFKKEEMWWLYIYIYIYIYIWGAIPGSKTDTCLNTREEPVNSYFLLKETLAAILAV
jgi:hypothetical protein